MGKKIRLLLVDDQRLFVQSLKTVLEALATDVDAISVAFDGREAIGKIEKEGYDIALMDVRMSGMDGVEAIKEIRKRKLPVRVIMLTTFNDDDYVYQALSYGAVGYLLKDISAEELISSIYAVRDGAVLISPSIARILVTKKKTDTDREACVDEDVPSWWCELSRREREVLKVAIEGWSNQDIANKLFIARYTVRNHLSVIYSKLNVSDRMELKRYVESQHIDLSKLSIE